MASTYSDLLGYEKQATGENSATWGDVLNTTLELLEDSIAGSLSKSVAGSSDVTLTDLDGAIDEHRKMMMEFTGTLTGNINVIVPATSKLYFIHNNTSGAFTLTVKPSAGTGIAVTQGSKDILIADGTNVVRAIDVSSYTHPNHSGDVTSSGDGATTIVNDAVTTDKIINDAVSLAKMAAGTTGEVITYDGSGNPATLAVGTSGHYLKTNGAGNLPTWEAVDALPSQTGQGGEYLKTDGSTATWEPISSGATGAGGDAVFVENELIVTTDYELSTNKSAMSVGPVTVNSGVSVTIPSGHTWVVL
jgi:hypothetical protein